MEPTLAGLTKAYILDNRGSLIRQRCTRDRTEAQLRIASASRQCVFFHDKNRCVRTVIVVGYAPVDQHECFFELLACGGDSYLGRPDCDGEAVLWDYHLICDEDTHAAAMKGWAFHVETEVGRFDLALALAQIPDVSFEEKLRLFSSFTSRTGNA